MVQRSGKGVSDTVMENKIEPGFEGGSTPVRGARESRKRKT